MSHRSDCLRTLVATAAVLLTAGASFGATPSPIVIRVYDAAAGSETVRAAAIRAAARIIDAAGVRVDWRDCTTGGAEPRCQDGDRTRDLIVRIMPALSPGAPLYGSSLQVRSKAGASELPLGVAVIDPRTLAGELATVFREPVLAVARRTGVADAELLGRALAHEVGHLLLRERGHSATGLMRAVWSDEELTENRPADWVFAPRDVRRVQSRFSSEATP